MPKVDLDTFPDSLKGIKVLLFLLEEMLVNYLSLLN